MRCITNLSDDSLRVGFERTGYDDEANECQVFLNVFATQLTHLNTIQQTHVGQMFHCGLHG